MYFENKHFYWVLNSVYSKLRNACTCISEELIAPIATFCLIQMHKYNYVKIKTKLSIFDINNLVWRTEINYSLWYVYIVYGVK